MVKTFKSRVFFLTVYIKEAHACDEWKLGDNICIQQHKSIEERLDATKLMMKGLNYHIPTVVDGIENSFEKMFAVWPERYILLENNDAKLLHVSNPEAYGHNPQTFCRVLMDCELTKVAPNTME
ncbi:hypothetical protein FDP41_008132 [Naegleria fowleri]|uniref:Iodothyronine deiodinase n=1 Tax=Naegleria fowleri TaxID=5763 RepID=A0A6A5BHB7_NAEFO|nr:uncharacterized protein FDP41_008132 [Naegleria fowleri]KAF0973428.1 hypothetical protein FDP41_008132 [Naegleria fowleri]CAG4708154.1 unnamed protein product [Naegleria fowleri]